MRMSFMPLHSERLEHSATASAAWIVGMLQSTTKARIIRKDILNSLRHCVHQSIQKHRRFRTRLAGCAWRPQQIQSGVSTEQPTEGTACGGGVQPPTRRGAEHRDALARHHKMDCQRRVADQPAVKALELCPQSRGPKACRSKMMSTGMVITGLRDKAPFNLSPPSFW